MFQTAKKDVCKNQIWEFHNIHAFYISGRNCHKYQSLILTTKNASRKNSFTKNKENERLRMKC